MVKLPTTILWLTMLTAEFTAVNCSKLHEQAELSFEVRSGIRIKVATARGVFESQFL